MTERPVVIVQNEPAPVIQIQPESGPVVSVVLEPQPSVITLEIPGPMGPAGPPGGGGTGGVDAYYVHEQPVASTLWVCNHNLGKHPAITVEDSAGTIVSGRYQNLNVNTTELRFSAPFGGKAYFS